jgi:hypothetical protein
MATEGGKTVSVSAVDMENGYWKLFLSTLCETETTESNNLSISAFNNFLKESVTVNSKMLQCYS